MYTCTHISPTGEDSAGIHVYAYTYTYVHIYSTTSEDTARTRPAHTYIQTTNHISNQIIKPNTYTHTYTTTGHYTARSRTS
jgi:hypothetical protein